MITSEQRARLVEIVYEANLDRVFRDADKLAARLDAFAAHYAEKGRGLARGALPVSTVTLDGVLKEHGSNPYRVQALLQAIAFSCSPEMLVMLWIAELGATVHTLTLDYERHGHAQLDVELRLLDGSLLRFGSSEVWDLAVLRLVGLAKANDAPEMSGFYPLFLPTPSGRRAG